MGFLTGIIVGTVLGMKFRAKILTALTQTADKLKKAL